MMRLLVTLLAGLLLAGCATSRDDSLAPKTANHVDLKRYQGTWYELARLPMYFNVTARNPKPATPCCPKAI